MRTLCLQEDPSNALILLTLDELAKMARKIEHDEAEMFEELCRQANRYQSKLQIANLCLSVLGGKVADTISKALSKCLKEKTEVRVDNKTATDAQKRPESPLNNLYPYQASMMYPMMPGLFPNMYNMGTPNGYANQGNRCKQNYKFRPRGPCHFCDSPTHFVKDCEKMKLAKGNK